jgi:signal peptidase I
MAAITSQSMYPALKRGDLVLIQGVDKAADLNEGDIIAFENDSGFAIHRIVAIDGETITTKGDANFDEDDPITFDKVIGRALTVRGRLARIPYLGNVPLVFGRTSDGNAGEAQSPPIFEGESDAGDGASASD